MQSLTLNFQNPQIFENVLWLLKHFEEDGIEIVLHEDNNYPSISFEEAQNKIQKAINNISNGEGLSLSDVIDKVIRA